MHLPQANVPHRAATVTQGDVSKLDSFTTFGCHRSGLHMINAVSISLIRSFFGLLRPILQQEPWMARKLSPREALSSQQIYCHTQQSAQRSAADVLLVAYIGTLV